MAKSGLSGTFCGTLYTKYIDGHVWEIEQKPGEQFGLYIIDYDLLIQPDDGFRFDFASIPAPVRWIYPKTGTGKSGQYGPAATIHDWIYSYPERYGLNQIQCDRIFLLGMEIKKVRSTMRSMFYQAVSIGGARYFGKPDKLNKLRGT
jgi:hypothetical protein